MDDVIASQLEQRLGRLHAKQRLGIEKDHEAQIFGQGINFFHIENWYSIHSLIRNALKLGGIFWRVRGMPNASRCGTIIFASKGYRVPSMASLCSISVISTLI
jgi:uncharacterized protein